MGQNKIVLCDTDVIIEFYKGNIAIIDELKKIGQSNIAISCITAGEIIFGALNKRELSKIKKDINHLILVELDNKTCSIFLDLIFTYSLSHNLKIPDGLIASTALAKEYELFTLNKKDFKFIHNLKLYKF